MTTTNERILHELTDLMRNIFVRPDLVLTRARPPPPTCWAGTA